MRQFWQTFVEERLGHGGASHTHAHAQPKSVFSYAVAVMDKIEGLEEEEDLLGSRFEACMQLDLHKGCDLQRTRKHARVLDAKI